MKTRRFDFNWKPLQLQISFVVDGSVPDKQDYNADTQEFTPDYTLTPLIIQPTVSIIDKDEMLASGSVNHELTNVRWYEIISGTRTLIDTNNTDYEITNSGGNAGRIKVKKNAEPRVPITLEFYAEYIDARTSQILTVRGSYPITCSNSTAQLSIELDAAEQTIYNPLSDPDTQTVTATVRAGDKVCPTNKYTLFWEVQDEDGAWREAGSDDMDYDITVSGNTAVVNRRLMGDQMYLRCRCKFNTSGTPSPTAPTDDSPQAIIAFIRRIPKYEFDFSGVPYNIPTGTLRIAPTAMVRTTHDEIADPEKELLPLWYIATNKASGSLDYSLVAHGVNPTFSTDKMDNNFGAVIALDVIDRGYVGAFTDNTDDAVLCDADGSILLIH